MELKSDFNNFLKFSSSYRKVPSEIYFNIWSLPLRKHATSLLHRSVLTLAYSMWSKFEFLHVKAYGIRSYHRALGP